jgi:hypothetical protein
MRSLASRYFHTFGDTVRRDLEEDFKRIEEQYYESIRQTLGNEFVSQLEPATTEYIRKTFVLAGWMRSLSTRITGASRGTAQKVFRTNEE